MNQTPAAPAAEGLGAPCVRCGAPQAIVLDGRARPCSHCRAPDPLDPATRARVHAASGAVARIAAREQQRLGAHAARVVSLAWEVPLIALPMWLLFGGIALWVASSDLPKGWTMLRLLGSGAPPRAAVELVSAWWVMALGLTGIALSLTTYLAVLWRLRASVRPPPSMAPLAAGAPARCHLCGAGLPGSEARRTCRACGAGNLVDDAAFRGATADLAAHVAHVTALDAASAGDVDRAAGRVIFGATAFPVLLLVALPIGWFAPGTPLAVLALPAVVAALAVPIAIAIAVQPSPRVPAFMDLLPGHLVRLRGVAHAVVARLEVDLTKVPTGCGFLWLVAPEGARAPTLAVYAYTAGEAPVVCAFAVAEGGAALAPGEDDPAKLTAVGVLEAGGTSAGAAPIGAEPIRVFGTAAPRAGDRPRFTLTRTTLAADDVLVVAP